MDSKLSPEGAAAGWLAARAGSADGAFLFDEDSAAADEGGLLAAGCEVAGAATVAGVVEPGWLVGAGVYNGPAGGTRIVEPGACGEALCAKASSMRSSKSVSTWPLELSSRYPERADSGSVYQAVIFEVTCTVAPPLAAGST